MAFAEGRTDTANKAKCRVVPIGLVRLRIDAHRCRGHVQSNLWTGTERRCGRDSIESSAQPPKALWLSTAECTRRAVPRIRHTGSLAHPQLERLETDQPQEQKNNENGARFLHASILFGWLGGWAQSRQEKEMAFRRGAIVVLFTSTTSLLSVIPVTVK